MKVLSKVITLVMISSIFTTANARNPIDIHADCKSARLCGVEPKPPINEDSFEAGGVSFEKFKELTPPIGEKCVQYLSYIECTEELRYALNKNLISRRTFEWAYERAVYPLINRDNRIVAVCRC